jgi:hypothetical protein
MKTKICFMVCISILLVSFVCSAATENGDNVLRRFALIIGSNGGGDEREKLRYAAQDALSFARVMKELGALQESDLVVLLDPTASEVRKGFSSLREKASDTGKRQVRKEAVVYYSGHSDDEGLLLGREKISYSDMRAMIASLDVNVRVAILDSCSSGAFTRAKGVIKRPAFLVDSSSETKGYAFLTSSAEDEVAQESDKIEGSFFTHYLVSGLRGAADTSNDGLVTLNEAYSYAFRETLARTEKTQYGAQHPKYDIQLTGTGDLVLTDLRVTSCGLVIKDELEGKFFVRDSSGNLIAEIDKLPGSPVDLGIEPGSYELTAEMKGKLYRATIVLTENKHVLVSKDNLIRTEGETTTPRGDVAVDKTAPPEDADQDTIPFHFSFMPGVSLYGKPGIHGISVGLLVDDVIGIHGAELSSIGNFAEDDVTGFQGAGIFNRTGKEIKGMQSAGIINFAHQVRGVQLAGIANFSSGRVEFTQIAGIFNLCQGLTGLQLAGTGNNMTGGGIGMQAAVIWNSADALSGAQLSGIINMSDSITGAQIGLINVTGRITGMQIGLVNISDTFEGGFPIGLVNIVKDGTLNLDVWYDDIGYMNTDFRTGSKNFYSIFKFSFIPSSDPFAWSYGAGIGFSVPFDPLYLDIDATMNVMQIGPENWYRTDLSSFLPEVSATLGIGLGRFGLFCGASVGVEIPGWYRERNPAVSVDIPTNSGNLPVTFVPHFFAGIRL